MQRLPTGEVRVPGKGGRLAVLPSSEVGRSQSFRLLLRHGRLVDFSVRVYVHVWIREYGYVWIVGCFPMFRHRWLRMFASLRTPHGAQQVYARLPRAGRTSLC